MGGRIIRRKELALAILIFMWMASANGAEISASQHLSKSEISLSESSTLSIDLNGTGTPCVSPIDVVLSIDSTGSMNQNDSNKTRLIAAEEFVRGMDFSKDRVGVVSWNLTALPGLSRIILAKSRMNRWNRC